MGYPNFREIARMYPEDIKKLLSQMAIMLEQSLPDKPEEVYFYRGAVAQFLEGLIYKGQLVHHPAIFGWTLHDLVAFIVTEWRTPAIMLAGLLEKILEPVKEYLIVDNERKEGKLFNATMGLINSIKIDLTNNKPIDSWKVWYLSDIAWHFAHNLSIPGMEGGYEPMMPNRDFVKEETNFVFDLDDNGNLRIIKKEDII